MKLYKVEQHPDLVKDMDSKAVLNTNYAALVEYRKKQEMKEEIDTLKNEVKDIKLLLNKIVNMLEGTNV
jgi:hypothetical protein